MAGYTWRGDPGLIEINARIMRGREGESVWSDPARRHELAMAERRGRWFMARDRDNQVRLARERRQAAAREQESEGS